MDFLDTKWIAGGAVLAAIVAGWNHVKAFVVQMRSRVIITLTVDPGFPGQSIKRHLIANAKCSRWGMKRYEAYSAPIRKLRRIQVVVGESPITKTGRLYWLGRVPLWVVTDSVYDGTVSVSFLRWTLNPDKFMSEAVASLNDYLLGKGSNLHGGARRSRFSLRIKMGTATRMDLGLGAFALSSGSQPEMPMSNNDMKAYIESLELLRLLDYTLDDIGEWGSGHQGISRLVLSPQLEELLHEARQWLDSETWYADRGLTWKHGWLLHGVPGAGKSAFIRALAEELDLPVYVFELSTFHPDEFLSEWQSMLAHTPCIVLFEDIDSTFNGRAQQDNVKLNFATLLNALDGVQECNGLFLVITTNCYDKVDAALGGPSTSDNTTRPGRINRVVELELPGEATRQAMVKKMLPQYDLAEAANLVNQGKGYTMAQFQSLCAERALNDYWHEQAQQKPGDPHERRNSHMPYLQIVDTSRLGHAPNSDGRIA